MVPASRFDGSKYELKYDYLGVVVARLRQSYHGHDDYIQHIALLTFGHDRAANPALCMLVFLPVSTTRRTRRKPSA